MITTINDLKRTGNIRQSLILPPHHQPQQVLSARADTEGNDLQTQGETQSWLANINATYSFQDVT